MSWKSDWLYQRIFEQVQNVWHKTHRGDDELLLGKTPPDAFLIHEYASFRVVSADNAPLSCVAQLLGEPVRHWRYQIDGLQRLVTPSPIAAQNTSNDEMYYPVGRVLFGIGSDRKLVFLVYSLGQLYAWDGVYAVQGQGKRGVLLPAPNFVQHRA